MNSKANPPLEGGYLLTAQVVGGELRFPLATGEYIVGSSSTSDLQIDEATVSRKHARLQVMNDSVLLTDLSSSNGTRLDGQRIKQKSRIRVGQAIRFGQVEAHLSPLGAEELNVAVPADEGRPDQSSETGPTLAASRMGLFYVKHIRPLIKAMGTSGFLARLVDALAEASGGVVEIRRGDGLLAASGEGDSKTRCSAGDGRYLVLAGGFAAEAEPLVNELLSIAMELIAIHLRTGADRAEGETGVSAAGGVGGVEAPDPPDPPTGHAGLRDIYRQAARVAGGGISVLIEGESGTGKELLARYLHQAGSRGEQPLVVLNCASLPKDLLEAELFGIEKGVATGVDARPGKFELADGGSLFLDEIGDMALDTQAKILRVLQEREVHRVGGQKGRPVNVRVISATNQPMDDYVAEGRFRRDLYHRIADWTVRLPSLRERRMDVANLAAYFLREASGKVGHRFGGLSEGAVSTLSQYPWPGNVRELEREMARCALFLGDGELLRSEMLQPRIREGAEREQGGGMEAELARAEKRMIEAALEATGGNVAEAAELLKVGQSTLYRRIKVLEVQTA